MIKKITLIILFSFTFLAAQTEEGEDQNPNVELPDFVITGTDVLSIQTGKKIQPEFVSTLSEETLKPVYSAEQLEMRELSNPVKDEIGLFDSLNYYSGMLKAGAGFYTLPVAELRYAVPFSRGIFEGFAGGKNIRSYEPNSGRYNASAGLNLKFFTPGDGTFLPGSQFILHGDYGRSSFKFYGGPRPLLKREMDDGNFSFNFNSISSRIVTAGLRLEDQYYQLKGEDFSEHYFTSGAYIKAKISSFNITLDGGFNRQMLSRDSSEDRHSLLYLRPAAGFTFSKTVRTSFGLTYSKAADESFIAPYAAVNVKMGKYLSLFGEYSPSAEIFSAGHFLSVNRFFDINRFRYLYAENINMTGVLKYEYDKYFEIDGGVRYKSSDRIPYFTTSEEGKFSINVTDGEIITAFANFLFHRGPYGRFYGTVELNSANDTSDSRIPYHPAVNAELSYGYLIGPVDFYSTLYYSSSVFTDISNDEEIGQYVDLGAGMNLKIKENFSLFFELNNLLSRNNFIWRGYKEPPLDLVGGLIFRW